MLRTASNSLRVGGRGEMSAEAETSSGRGQLRYFAIISEKGTMRRSVESYDTDVVPATVAITG